MKCKYDHCNNEADTTYKMLGDGKTCMQCINKKIEALMDEILSWSKND